MAKRTIAFMIPIMPGKTDEAREILATLTGDRKDDHNATMTQHGVKRMKVWHQRRPQEAMIIYLESDDIDSSMKSRAESDHPFDDWFDRATEAVTGIHPDKEFRDAPSELLMDWHVEKGHKYKAEH